MRALPQLSWIAGCLALCGVGCSEGPYILGSSGVPSARYCPEGSDCAGRFEVALSRAGTGLWSDRWVAGGRERATALLLRGEDASADRWLSRTGGSLRSSGAEVGIVGPFQDETRAVSTSLPYESDAAWVLPPTDLVIELVLRAEPMAEVVELTSASRAMSIASDASNALTLRVGDHELGTSALIAGAWYHVVFELHDRRPSAVYVDGLRSDAPAIASSGGGDAHSVRVGGAGDAAIAWLAVVPWDDAALDESMMVERFAQLTGVLPALAGGDPLPSAMGRDSGAFVDSLEPDGARRLHLVGERWPRVTCRPDARGARFCGYLSEDRGERRLLPFDPAELRTLGVSAERVDTSRAIGRAAPTVSLRGDRSLGRHAVEARFEAEGTIVLSFFARAAAATELGVALEGIGEARVDLATRTSSADSGLRVRLEDYGAGFVRCAITTSLPGLATRALTIAARVGGSDTFADGGEPLFELAGLQLETNRVTATSLIVDVREADRLVFAAEGNVPMEGTGHLRARVLVAPGERLHDETILNASLGARTDQQLNLYVSTPGTVVFVAAQSSGLRWLVPSEVSAVEGVPVVVEASWSPGSARLRVDAAESSQVVDEAFVAGPYDQLALGFSGSTSGVIDGLIAEIGVGP